MKRLSDILPQHFKYEVIGDIAMQISSLQIDSRAVQLNSLFAAMPGTTVDGNMFIASALQSGATAILTNAIPATINKGVTYIITDDVPELFGQICSAFFDHPARNLNLVGVTGTNGKTTVASLLYQLFSTLGYKTGLISTVENIIYTKKVPATHTTPHVLALYALLNEMVQAGCTYVFMEVSSHAIHQNRIAGLKFAGGIFTNLSHDHLDYHGTFKEYIYVKKRFFDSLSPQAFALINKDDVNGQVMVQNSKARIYKYSLESIADFKFKILDASMNGLHLKYNNHDLHVRLIGLFNAYNLLAVLGTAILLEQNESEVLTAITNLQPAAGRLDWVKGKKLGVTAVVDYAHTPDALEKVIVTLKKNIDPSGRLITVVGCGGNRDSAKRPIMAHIATSLSDKVIFTSDNPRNENPSDILQQMEIGVLEENKHTYLIIESREQAIKAACQLAQPNDIILVAGKGHENYQEIKGEKFPFDDKQMLKAYLL